jgi:hypothetical protein
MPFGLKNAPPTYQRIVSMAFKEYLGIFMKLFMDNFNVFNDRNIHLQKLHLLFWQVSQIWYQLKSWQMHVYGVFQRHFGIHCVTRRQAIISKEIFGNYQHVTIENSKGHISFHWNGSILPMFHLEFYFHHGTHHQIIVESQNLWMDRGVLIGLGCNSTIVCGCTNIHHPQVGSKLSCSHWCFKLNS